MEDFTTWETSALVLLYRMLSLTKAIQTSEELLEIDAVMTELTLRGVDPRANWL